MSFRISELFDADGQRPAPAEEKSSGGKAQLRKELLKLDKNGDGVISTDELSDFVEAHAKAKNDLRMMKMIVLLLFFVILITVAATVGLTYALLVKMKETSVNGSGTMTVAGTSTPVATRATYATVDDDIFNMTLDGLFELKGITFNNYSGYGIDIFAKVDGGIRFTTDSIDSITNKTVEPHVKLKTSLGDIFAFPNGSYGGPAIDNIILEPASPARRVLINYNAAGGPCAGTCSGDTCSGLESGFPPCKTRLPPKKKNAYT